MKKNIALFLGLMTLGFSPFASAKENIKSEAAGTKSADAETAKLLLTISEYAMGLAKDAQSKQISKATADYAKTVFSDHAAIKAKTEEISQVADIAPKDSARSRVLEGKGRMEASRLAMFQGAKFESEFIASITNLHTEALAILKSRTAANEQLKNHLTTARERVQSHLDQAKKLKAPRTAG